MPPVRSLPNAASDRNSGIARGTASIRANCTDSGPQIDNLESRDDRVLIPGVGFSIEPGIYLPGELGIRSEVNCYVGEDALLVTPRGAPQRDLIVV